MHTIFQSTPTRRSNITLSLKMRLWRLALLSCLPLLAGTSHAEQATVTQPLLSDHPRLQALLRNEMRALLTASNTIANALPQGDWPAVAATAKAMHDSFIFQQKLTAKDRDILHHSLPAAFLHLDEGFHQRAMKLHQAAASEDAELSLYHYSRLLESCSQCHQRFASHRFPGLKEHRAHAPHH